MAELRVRRALLAAIDREAVLVIANDLDALVDRFRVEEQLPLHARVVAFLRVVDELVVAGARLVLLCELSVDYKMLITCITPY